MVIFPSPAINQDPHLGWTNFIEGCIETCDIPGDHQQNRRQIMNEPFVQILASELKKYIGKAAPENRSLNRKNPVSS